MKPKMIWIYIGLVILAVITGWVVYRVVSPAKPVTEVVEEEVEPTPPPADSSLVVSLTKSRVKDNTVVVEISKLAGKYQSLAYELTYDSQGLIKGVNSGSKPIELAGKDTFEREIYLGTCSRNVCKPDTGVKQVSLALEFIDLTGQKSQFSKDYEL